MNEPPLTLGSPSDDWPMFGLTTDIRPALKEELGRGRAIALATLYAAEGGAPRGVGAQMLVTADGNAAGYLSGGCVEADLVLHGRAVIADGQPRVLVYGRGGPIDIRLPCGSRIEVLLERLLPGDAAAGTLLDLAERRVPAYWATNGRERLCAGEPLACEPPFLFVRRHEPQKRVIALGSDPVTLALCTLAGQAGHDVVLVRPKGPLSAPPIAGIRYVSREPAAAIAGIGPDAWTAIVVGLHDEIHDHSALAAALHSDAGYVGLVGSSRRLPEKIGRLRAAGVPDSHIAELKAPAGLSLGGRGPWDIATAIFAELIQHSAQSMRADPVLAGRPDESEIVHTHRVENRA